MKKLLSLSLLIMMSVFVYAQAEPPKQVTDAFAQKFAGSSDVEWSQESPEVWEADFEQADMEKSACFNVKGEWLETETVICKSELPAEIFKTLALIFEGFNIEEVDKIETADLTGYELDLEKGNTELEILAAPDGTFTLESIDVEEPCPPKCCPQGPGSCPQGQKKCPSKGMEEHE